MYRALVIDDEPRACHILEILVSKHLPEITTFRRAISAGEGIAAINTLKPQLVFLDIEMPLQNGFDVLNAIDEIDFEVVFTTAYSQFALQAIKVSALDYLLKPIDVDELRLAFEKFMRKQPQSLRSKSLIRNLAENLNVATLSQQKLPIATTEGLHFLPIAEIIRCEASSNYTFFYLTGNRRFCASKTLKEFEGMLKDHDFVRVHKSHLVNMQFVKLIDQAGVIHLIDHSQVVMSRRQRRNLL